MRILDATCAGRHLWVDKDHADAIYVDRRILVPGTIPVRPNWCIRPDVCADFTALPFAPEIFDLVVYDPPHIIRAAPSASYLRTKYGELKPETWHNVLRAGFDECWRVLRAPGFLHFKWARQRNPGRGAYLVSEAPAVQEQARCHVVNFCKGRGMRFNAAYAQACREHCRPLGCSDDPRCWVKDGTSASIVGAGGGGSGSPRCLACTGVIRQRRYFSSEGLRTPGNSPAASPAGSGRATPAE